MGRDFLKNRTIQEGGNETGCREAVDEGQRKNLAETVKAEKSDDVSRSYSESPREKTGNDEKRIMKGSADRILEFCGQGENI